MADSEQPVAEVYPPRLGVVSRGGFNRHLPLMMRKRAQEGMDKTAANVKRIVEAG